MLKLQEILKKYGIKNQEYLEILTQGNGEKFSKAAISLLLNREIFPKNTPFDSIQAQTNDFLRAKGVSEIEIKTAFQSSTQRNGIPTEKVSQQQLTSTYSKRGNMITQSLTEKAKKHFRLIRSPFQNDVERQEDVFLSKDQSFILDAMYYTAKAGGFMAVVGESGSGKTTLRRELMDRCRRDEINVTFVFPRSLDKTRLLAAAVCDSIILDVSNEKPVAGMERKTRQMERVLTESTKAGRSHCMIIEEAHDLHIQTLKFLKRVYDMEFGFRKLVSVILLGQPELRGKLDERQNYAAREVIRRCEVMELNPLDREVASYLKLKFARIGKEVTEIFTEDAYDAIRDRLTVRGLSETYPLIINNYVVQLLNEAARIGVAQVNAELVRETK